jgi:hypothetical protein
MKHIKYAAYVIRHKWYVFVECLKAGIPVRGIMHDMSKLRPSEWFPYANYFYKDSTGNPPPTGDDKFDFAWLLHQKRNDHHWQFWLLPEDDGGVKILPMSKKARLEMVCDWKGAARALRIGNRENNYLMSEWYEKNKGHMQLNPETRKWVEDRIS